MKQKANHILNLGILLVITLLYMAMPVTAFAGRIIYVDDDAKGANNGLSWADAYMYLQDALADANSSAKTVEIHVAQGIYKPDQGANQALGDRMATFQLIKGVSLRGGYAGTGAPDPNTRNINAYKTILSGDLADNDATTYNPPFPLYYEDPSRTDNSFRVVTVFLADPNTLLDGFVVTAAYEYPFEDAKFSGAGLYVGRDVNLTVQNCVFTANAATGVLCNWVSNPTFKDCVFANNTASYEGGGIFIRDGGSPHLIRCTFEDNRALDGGGLYNRNGCLLLEDCTFIRNIACGMRCANVGYGGGLYSLSFLPGSKLNNCEFIANIASEGGGAYLGYSGMSPPLGRDEKIMLTGCTFIQNQASFGGAIRQRVSILHVEHSVFCENSALYTGGAISNSSSITNLSHCIFSGNSASLTGASVFTQGSRSFSLRGHEISMEFILTLNSCTFACNLAPTGRAIACKSYGSQDLDNIIISNCILDNGDNEIHNDKGSKTTITYTNLSGGISSVHDPFNTLIWGQGNIDADPCFADPGRWVNANDPNQIAESNDPNAVWIDGDYHLKSQAGRWDPVSQTWVKNDVTSPCIDAGDPNTPVGDEPFPNGGRINMGAYGGTAEASKSYFGEPVCETIVAGDINGDCKVDFKDLQLLAIHWLKQH